MAISLIKLIFFMTTLLSCFIAYSFEVSCYKCSVSLEKTYINNATIITQMCSKFDESDKFVVDCPFSTMCLKVISTLHLQNGKTQEAVMRGCAQQKNTTQVFRNRQWEQEHSVQEVYEEGCVDFKENQLSGFAKKHCYCRGDLCNSSNNNAAFKILIAFLSVILISGF